MPIKGPDMYGRVWTGQYRLRPTLFGLAASLEELVENHDGTKRWMKSWRTLVIIGRATTETSPELE